MPRILVADDHEIVRRGVRALLEGQIGWEVCEEAADGREAVEKAKRCMPDVVILDLGMPRLNGLEAARQIRKASPGTEVLILTMHESEHVVREVLGVGARGYVLKSDAGRDLVAAVKALLRHHPFFTSHVTEFVLERFLKGRVEMDGQDPSALSAREREVTQLLAEGNSTKEVATALGISVKTAETHRTNIMRKIGCHSVTEIVRYAIRNKFLEP